MKRIVWLSAVALVSWSCGLASSVSQGGGSFSGGGEAGATTGGVKDLALARAKVKQGVVPAVEDLAYEGLYAEHDLPVQGAPCQEAFCARVGTAIAADGAATTASGWIQVGLSSGVDLTTFRRPALNVALVIDNSCSMGTEKMEAVKAAGRKLVSLLGPDDRVALVRFDDVAQVLVPAGVPNTTRLEAALAGVHAAGGTCIECGLRVGLDQLRAVKDPARANRVLLMTDAQPNVGATGASDFMTLLEAAAREQLHLTLFGVGLDFGQALTAQVSSVEGANAVFLADAERTRQVFDQDFDLLVTPLAYDLQLALTPAGALGLDAVYGVPGEPPTAVESHVKTVFLSRNRGALVVKLRGAVTSGQRLGELTLKYRPVVAPAAPAAESRVVSLPVDAPTGDAPQYSGAGVRKAIALTSALTSLRDAVRRSSQGDAAGAVAAAAAAQALLQREGQAIQDDALLGEAQFAAALQALLANH